MYDYVHALVTLRRTVGKPLSASPDNADPAITALCSDAMTDAQGLTEAQYVSGDLRKRLETAISTLGSKETPNAYFRFATKLDKAGLR